VDFLYKNLESLLCIIVAGLLLVMTLSRAQAQSGPVCLTFYLHVEKNTTSVLSVDITCGDETRDLFDNDATKQFCDQLLSYLNEQ
jgi:hypothetical protein